MKQLRNLFLVFVLLLLDIGAQAQTTFGIHTTGVICSSLAFDTVLQGRACVQLPGSSIVPQYSLKVTGTACTLSYYAQTGPPTVKLTIDGGTQTTATLSTGSWATLTLFTGLTDTAHTVLIDFSLGSGQFYNFLIDENAFSVTGSAPAITYYTGYVQPLSIPTQSTNLLLEGGWTFQTSAIVQPTYNDSEIRFSAKLTDIRLWVKLGGGSFRLAIDGVDQNSGMTTVASTFVGGWQTIGTGLDGTAYHTYEISFCNGPSAYWTLTYIMLSNSGSPATFNPTNLAPRPTCLWIGHSFVYGTTGTSNDNTLAECHRFGRTYNVQVFNLGIVSDTVLTAPAGTNTGLMGKMGYLCQSNTTPYCIIVDDGFNDVGSPITGETASAYAACYAQWATMVSAQFPQAKIIIMSMLRMYSGATQTTIDSYNSAAATAIAALSNPNIVFFSQTACETAANGGSGTYMLTSSDYNNDTPQHPHQSGYTKILGNLESQVGLVPTPPNLATAPIGRGRTTTK